MIGMGENSGFQSFWISELWLSNSGPVITLNINVFSATAYRLKSESVMKCFWVVGLLSSSHKNDNLNWNFMLLVMCWCHVDLLTPHPIPVCSVLCYWHYYQGI
jgi:hypothetical protein